MYLSNKGLTYSISYNFGYSNQTHHLFDVNGDDSKSYYVSKGPNQGIFNFKTNVKLYQQSEIDQIRIHDNKMYIKIGDTIYIGNTSSVNGNVYNEPIFYKRWGLIQFDITIDSLYIAAGAVTLKIPIENGVPNNDKYIILLNTATSTFHYHNGFIYYGATWGVSKVSITQPLKVIKLFYNFNPLNYQINFAGNCIKDF